MSGILQKLIAEFKNKLQRNYSLKIPDDWLIQCAEFIYEEFPGKQINEYIDLIFKQLLDYDLTEIGTECLPNDLFNTDNGTLNGVFLLQLHYCMDTSQSLFSRIQKLRGIISENALVDADNVPTGTQFGVKEKKNRLMTVYLTDGKKHIAAVENKFIPFLTEDLLPGTKIEIRGRINYQNKLLLLESENIKILGGSVEEISTVAHLVEVIESEIATKYEEGSANRREKSQTFDTSSNKHVYSSSRQGSSDFQNNKFKNEKFSQNQQHQKNSFSSNLTFQNNKLEDSDEDELLMKCDLNPFEVTSTRSININVKNDLPPMKRPPSTETLYNPSFPSKTSNTIFLQKKQKVQDIMQIDDDENDYQRNNQFVKNQNNNYNRFNQIDEDEDVELLEIDERSLKSNKQVNPKIQNKDKENQGFSSNLKGNNKCIVKVSNLLDQAFLNSCCFKSRPFDNSAQNFSTCVHSIRGFFRKVTAPLTQIKLKWYQEIQVSDGTSDLICYIGDEPLSNLLELTCKEAKDLFKKSKESGDKEYHLLFEQKRKNCELKLKTMNALISFRYDFDKNKFCIFKLDNIEFNRA